MRNLNVANEDLDEVSLKPALGECTIVEAILESASSWSMGRQAPSSLNRWRNMEGKPFLSLKLIVGKSVVWIGFSR
jgi:hypothetical protein